MSAPRDISTNQGPDASTNQGPDASSNRVQSTLDGDADHDLTAGRSGGGSSIQSRSLFSGLSSIAHDSPLAKMTPEVSLSKFDFREQRLPKDLTDQWRLSNWESA